MSSGPDRRAGDSSQLGGRNLTMALFVCVLAGLVGLAWGLFSPQPLRAWQSIQINFMYWTGLAFAGVVIAAIFSLTESRWGYRVRRLAECSVALVPVAWIAYGGVVAGHHTLAPAVHHMEHLAHAKQVWLDPTFLLARDGVALLWLTFVALWFVSYSVRVDLGAPPDGYEPKKNGLTKWLTRGFRGYDAESKRAKRVQYTLAPVLIVSYALVFTLFAFDQVMALDPSWISTLFGGYIFITTLLMGWASLSTVAVAVSERKGDDALSRYGRAITVTDRHDLGKLFFAFTMLSADFFWSQFVVIWYANVPEETPFLVRRIHDMPWRDIAWAVLIFGFAVPFFFLLFRRVKRTKATLAAAGVLVLIMFWVERFLLIVPSTWIDHTGRNLPGLPLGLPELLVTLGFLGLAGFCYRWALGQFVVPPRPIPDPEEEEEEVEEAEGEADDV